MHASGRSFGKSKPVLKPLSAILPRLDGQIDGQTAEEIKEYGLDVVIECCNADRARSVTLRGSVRYVDVCIYVCMS